MFIYVLAIIIILLGIFFLLTSIEVVPVKKKKYYKNNQLNKPNETDAELIVPEKLTGNEEEDIPKENYSIIHEDSDNHNFNVDNNDKQLKINIEAEENIKDCYQVIMFEDKDNIVNDSLNNLDAESSYQKLSKLKRVGKGELLFLNDALEFHCIKKMFRYDFKNIEYIYRFKNNLVLKLNKFSYKNIFIIDSHKEKIVSILKKYSFYKEEVE